MKSNDLIIPQFQITSLFTATYQFILVTKCPSIEDTDLSSVKNYIIAGSKVASHTIAQMNELLPNGQVSVGYGLSEVGFVAINTTQSTKSGESCGSLLNRFEAKIIDGSGERVGIDKDGELCVRSFTKFAGYYNNPLATEELFDQEDFVLTGDIGHFDESGYLHIVDRKKDIFKCYSTHISPSEIEEVLLNCVAIESVCVVGIPDPEELAPNLTAAVVIKRKDHSVTEENILDFATSRQFSDQFDFFFFYKNSNFDFIVPDNLPKTKQLVGGAYFVESLPLTPSGKIIRREVQKIATSLFNDKRKNKQ